MRWLGVLLLLALVPVTAQDTQPPKAPPASGEEETAPAGQGGEQEKPPPGEEGAGEETPQDEPPAEGQPPAEEPKPPAKPEGEPEKEPEAKPEEKPEERPAWAMPEKVAKGFGALLKEYFRPGKRTTRQEILEKLQKIVDRNVDGHSVLEDVAGIMAMANASREFGKFGKGRLQEVKVPPDVHGFPIGTVQYWLWVPKNYNEKQLWPLLFCMPDPKEHPDVKQFFQQSWVTNAAVTDAFLVAVPQPEVKGEEWTREKSLARAMITLRHCAGTFDVEKGKGGPATDALRIFVCGGEAAALTAARYPEVFAGAVLDGVDGTVQGTAFGKAGLLSGLPAYVVRDQGKAAQVQFATQLKAANDATAVADAEDGAAIAGWLGGLPRRASQPLRLEYAVHDGTFQRHGWINVLQFDATVQPAPSFVASCDRAKNEVRIEVDGVLRFELFLNDALVDLGRPVRIVVAEGEGKEYEFLNGPVGRNLPILLDELVASNHPWRVYCARYTVDLPTLRDRHAVQEG